MELPTPGAFVFLLATSIFLSLLVFAHASRNHNPRATLWGVVAFLFAALGVAAYFGHFWWTQRKRG